jgi:hypothetical protein
MKITSELLLHSVTTTFCKLEPKKYLSFFAFLFVTLNVFSQPVISSFSPATGPVGTTVTINGSGFSSTPSANIVFFGAVKATVSSASSSSLTVQVPAGATYQPITVTTNNLTAYSAKPFVVTFLNGTLHSKSFSYAGKLDSLVGSRTNDFEFGDLDGDGLADLSAIDWEHNTLSIYKNTSTGENFTFTTKIDYPTGNAPINLALGDIDGDGKLDIAVCNQSSNTISIYKNTSSTGSISFTQKTDFTTAIQPTEAIFDDFDGDGKSDLAIACLNFDGKVSFLRNTTSSGIISFASKFDLVVSVSINNVASAKMDGDDKPDLIFTSQAGNLYIVKNNSSVGNLSFAAGTSQFSGLQPSDLAVGDLDSDGKTDIAVSDIQSQKISFVRNTSAGSTISLAPKIDQYGITNADGIAIGDLDGDGKPDVAVTNSFLKIEVFKNNSIPGTISFGGKETYTSSGSQKMAIADINNDGKQDLAIYGGIFRVFFWRNDATKASINAFTPAIAGQGTTVTITGYYLTGATSVHFGGVPATSFTVVNSNTITAIVGTGVSGDIQVVTPNGTATISGFVFTGPPSITSFTPTTANGQTLITIVGNNFSGTTSVKFGGIPATSFTVVSPTSITAFAGNGTSGDVSLTNPYGTATLAGFTFIPPPTITSFSPVGAATGETVTITGTNLGGATAVSFGNTSAASFTVVSTTTITAVVGAGSPGNVTVVTPGGSTSKSGYSMLPTITSFAPTTGGRGTIVTITGTNFSGITGVKFGVINASSFTLNSSTSISAIVGGGASGDVSLITAAGVVSKPGFTFISEPTITYFSPLMGGPGTVVTITGSNFTNASAISIGGSPASSFTVLSPTTITAVVANNSSGSITVTTPGGTVSKAGFVFITAPIINSIAPLSGIPGITVTITGANFNTSSTGNTVYFGSVRAGVLSASQNSLTVRVPFGATYGPVTVSTGFLTAFSLQGFTPIALNSQPISSSTFSGKTDFNAGTNPISIAGSDFDGDGKTDLVVANYSSNILSIYRNTSSGNVMSFDKTDFSSGNKPHSITIADVNSNGKPDILYSTKDPNGSSAGPDNSISILENRSIPGNILFNSRQTFQTGFDPSDIAVNDLDRDGKPDIVVINFGEETISVFINNSVNGNISLRQRRDLLVGPSNTFSGLSGVSIGDLDGDEKPEIAVGNGFDTFFSIFKNETAPGVTSFFGTLYENFRVGGGGSSGLTIADFDLDDKPDMIGYGAIMKNTSTPIYFDFAIQHPFDFAGNVSIGDINGDNKPDFVRLSSPNAVAVVINTSLSGNISFAPKLNFSAGDSPTDIWLGDLDGDGMPEIVTANYNDNNISILKDQAGRINTTICAGSNKSLITQNTGTNYQWQENSGTGFVNISNGGVYQGVTTNTLQLSTVSASLNGYQYRCLVDGNADIPFVLTVTATTPAAVSIAASATTYCAGSNVTFTATPTNGGTSPSYQWKVNGVNAGTNSNTFTSSTLNNNDQVSVVLTSNASCITTPTANSNIITVTVNSSSTPTVTTSVSANNICAGTSVTFTATPTNGGATPSYQWQVNNINVGTNSNTLTSSNLSNNDQVKVILTSNASCVTTPTATSTPITMIVNASIKLAGKASSPAQACAGTSYNVTFTSTNAPNGSSIQLWENINNGTFTSGNTQTYNGAALSFSITSSTSGTKKYFFKINPPAGNTCAITNNSDTSTTVIDQLAKSVTAVSSNTITVTNGDAGASYKWQVQNAGSWNDVTPLANGLSFTATTTGSYRVQATKGLCVEYSDAQTITVTNPNTNPSSQNVLLYPNPTQGTLTLDSLKLSDNWEVLDIVSLQSGQTVASFNIINQTKVTVHLEALSNGLYLAVLRRKDGSSISIEFVKM